jgi:hypothetical protein
MKKSFMGPLIGVAFLLVFLVVAVVFSTVIFSHAENAVNVTNMTNETRTAYNASTTVVQYGFTGFSVIGLLLAGGLCIFGGVLLVKALR